MVVLLETIRREHRNFSVYRSFNLPIIYLRYILILECLAFFWLVSQQQEVERYQNRSTMICISTEDHFEIDKAMP